MDNIETVGKKIKTIIFRRCQKWEKSFLDTLGSSSFDHISVARFTSLTLEEEMDNNTNSIMPYFAMNVLVGISHKSFFY